MSKETTADTAASPATGAKMADRESSALTASMASMNVSGETVGEHKKENGTRPNADVLVADDPDLWKPGPPPEDCPVCMIPLPIMIPESMYFSCCGKLICNGCVRESSRATMIVNSKRAKKELPELEPSCAFCRTPYCGGEGVVKQLLLRMEKGDCKAYFVMASDYMRGTDVIPQDDSKAMELYVRGAELGSTEAMAQLGDIYERGTMGVKKDMGKSREFFERAAKGGLLPARLFLADMEIDNNNPDLAIRHWKIAAEGGDPLGMEKLWTSFHQGKLTKADLEQTLRAHQSAAKERSSDNRERYAALVDAEENNDKILSGLYDRYYGGSITAKELNKALEVLGYES